MYSRPQILLYLSFNALGYLFMFISVMGTPGMLNEDKPGTSIFIKLMGIFLPVAWKGMPYLLIASVVAFYFQYSFVGRLCSITSLVLGLGVLLTQIGIYRTQERKG